MYDNFLQKRWLQFIDFFHEMIDDYDVYFTQLYQIANLHTFPKQLKAHHLISNI